MLKKVGMMQKFSLKNWKGFMLLIIVLTCCFYYFIQARQCSQFSTTTTPVHISKTKHPSSGIDELRRAVLQYGQCGKRSKNRGPGQKVVSYSFYGGGDKKYINGIKENIKGVKKYLPGWTMRLYVDIDNLEGTVVEFLSELKCSNSEIFDLCTGLELADVGSVSQKHGMLWRLLPLVDSLVDVVLVRDLDSRISFREVAAVSEWLNKTELGVHMMRDHPNHNWHVMGGLWGARITSKGREKWQHMIGQMFIQSNNWWWLYLEDQKRLYSVIWPQVKNDTLVHDSYHCIDLASEHMAAFPTQRQTEPDNFVGAVFGLTGTLSEECPVKCRPIDHKDWVTC